MEGFWLFSYVVLWVVVLLALGLLGLVFRQFGQAYLGTAAAVSRDGPPLGKRAPTFKAETLAGEGIVVPTQADGFSFLVFGRPLCPPCQQLIPSLDRAAQEITGVHFMFVCQSERELAEVFASETGTKTPVLAAPDRTLADRYRIKVSPFAVVLDSMGVTRSKGVVNDRKHIDALLQEAERNKSGASTPAPSGTPASTERRFETQ